MKPFSLHALGRMICAVLAPTTCIACDANVPHNTGFCAICAATVLPNEASSAVRLDSGRAVVVHAPWRYGGAVAAALNRLKHRDRADIAAPLGKLLGQHTHAASAGIGRIVPVPLHRSRLAERGFNQSALLASEVAATMGVPVAFDILRRTHRTAAQQDLSAAERRDNVRCAFETGSVDGQRILLVDDVATTGATLCACARALLDAGARHVEAAVVATRLSEGPGA